MPRLTLIFAVITGILAAWLVTVSVRLAPLTVDVPILRDRVNYLEQLYRQTDVLHEQPWPTHRLSEEEEYHLPPACQPQSRLFTLVVVRGELVWRSFRCDMHQAWVLAQSTQAEEQVLVGTQVRGQQGGALLQP